MYTGREYDADTGLYYYRARWYDPEARRFISEDPIGLNGGINLYAYVNNNPLRYVDPSGLWFGYDDLVFAVGGAVIGAGGRLVSDWISGEQIVWQNYVSVSLGGAITGIT